MSLYAIDPFKPNLSQLYSVTCIAHLLHELNYSSINNAQGVVIIFVQWHSPGYLKIVTEFDEKLFQLHFL